MVAAPETQDEVEASKMPLLQHLIELRQRLLYSFVGLIGVFLVCFFFAQPLYDFLAAPLADVLCVDERACRMIYTDLTEVFFTQIKIAFFFAAFFTFPLFEIQLWKFVAPGLYAKEKKALLPFLVMTPVLFFVGAAFVYYVIFPIAWEFFASFQQMAVGPDDLSIELEAKVNEYLSLSMRLIFAFGICFQLPVVMTLLSRAGIATAQGMADKRKYAIVGVFIVAAIFTPPDPLSQIALAIPVILLYEISIWIARATEKKRAKEEEAFAEEIRKG